MIKVDWANAEKTVIRLDYFEPITSWDEYQEAVATSHEMAKSQNHPVYFIHNPGKTPMPAGNAIAQIRRAMATAPKNSGAVLMIISNDFARRIIEVVFKIAPGPKHFYFVSSVEEAQRVIDIHREKTLAPQ